jgi:hypothetical protein
MADKIRTAVERGTMFDSRVGTMRNPNEVERVEPNGRRRLRDRIPTIAQLEALLRDGLLVLPARYFRGTYLDIMV